MALSSCRECKAGAHFSNRKSVKALDFWRVREKRKKEGKERKRARKRKGTEK